MDRYRRYAIYFTAAPGDLAAAGATWLGWDIARGLAVEQVTFPGIDMSSLTGRPRKYGFHGTLKAPFRMAEHLSEASLLDDLRAFTGQTGPIPDLDMEVSVLGRFFALTPTGETIALSKLASDCVREFDKYRAPMTEAELQKRRRRKLTPRQSDLLDRWGYPFVKAEFRFHMTLTGTAPSEQVPRIAQALDSVFGPLLTRGIAVDAISLCGERQDGFFEEIERLPLLGWAQNPGRR